MTLQITVNVEGDEAWPDLLERNVIHLGNDAPPIRIGGLARGMTSGLTSVAICIILPDGRAVLAETSLRLFLMAADLLRARYGEE